MFTFIKEGDSISIDELVKWTVAVDRRIIVLRAFKDAPLVRPSKVAEESGRSVTNVDRALNEMVAEGLVECVMPEKHSWKKYTLTEKGEEVLAALEEKNLLFS
jgi:DNA-binding MarR family transcriptional regulator